MTTSIPTANLPHALPRPRRFDLDWVRVCAFGLLVCYHVGMYYVSWDWHVKSPFAGPALEPLMLLTAPWRLSLLFLVSGVATAYLLARGQGSTGQAPGARSGGQVPKGFLAARSWRLLVPLVFGMLVVVVPQAYYEVVEKSGYSDGYMAFYMRYLSADPNFCNDGECLRLPTWNHLWFVTYLWVYTVALWALARLAPGALRHVGERLGAWRSGLGVLLWPALLLVVARVLLVGRFESTHALVDDWYNHAQYLPVFLLGYWLATTDAVWARIEQLRWPALWTALPCYLLLAWYFGTYTDTNPAPDWLRMSQRVAWGVNQWASIVAILGFARRHLHRDSPVLRYLSAAVLPVYILHQTVIVIVAHNAKPLGLTPMIEGPLLVVATFALCFGGYELIRRTAWLRPLFGLKALPKRSTAAMEAAATS